MQNTLTFQFPAPQSQTLESQAPESQLQKASDELLSMLALRTRSLWRLTSAGDAQEIMTPFRRAHFCIEVDGAWQTYQVGAPLPPCVRAEFVENQPNENISGLRNTLDLPQGGIAHQACRFFEARSGTS